MRHAKHNQQLGVKTAHRAALLSNMAAALFTHGRIRTTLTKAKALRPFAEKVITSAKKAKAAEDPQKALHHRRQAVSKVRDRAAVHRLFNELVDQFMGRSGGYTRIYKLGTRMGDAAEMALIELVPAADEGYQKRRRTAAKKKSGDKAAKVSEQKVEAKKEEKEADPTEEDSTPSDKIEANPGEEAVAESVEPKDSEDNEESEKSSGS